MGGKGVLSREEGMIVKALVDTNGLVCTHDVLNPFLESEP